MHTPYILQISQASAILPTENLPDNRFYPIQKSLGYIGLLGPKKFRTSITVRSQPSIISYVLARSLPLSMLVF